jgi:hypothetical protein
VISFTLETLGLVLHIGRKCCGEIFKEKKGNGRPISRKKLFRFLTTADVMGLQRKNGKWMTHF